MKVRVLPYKMASESGKALAKALGALRIKREGSKFNPKVGDVIVNWGCSTGPEGFSEHLLNPYASVKVASNKLSAFQKLQEHGLEGYLPRFTTDKEIAEIWIDHLGEVVVCRQTLTGHSGEGIVIAETSEEVADAPLYTQYIKKTKEWRAHASPEYVFFLQRKARKRDVPDDQVNWKIRNHQNGFIYAHNDGEAPPPMLDVLARSAVRAMGLDFGAVDIIETKTGELYILEVNTACGLTGATVDAYKNFLDEAIDNF